MNTLPPIAVLEAYELNKQPLHITVLNNGLINQTWKLASGNDAWILQRINDSVFKEPDAIANNIRQIAAYLDEYEPGYTFTKPISSLDGDQMIEHEGGYYRLFRFIPESQTITVVEKPEQAFEAARQFGMFTAILKDVDVAVLQITIPLFHDLTYRYEQFLQTSQLCDKERLNEVKELIYFLEEQSSIVATYKQICTDPEFRLRVTHHDTKISNVLFDKTGKGLCVIDLDTVMPGYFISDVGDMFRTYLSPVSEEETNIELIEVRDHMYTAIVDGYSSKMEAVLTAKEKSSFFYAAIFMVYMQALRFMTDHLNGDVYYQIKYPGHNLNRAINQITLLKRLLEKKDHLENYRPTRL